MMTLNVYIGKYKGWSGNFRAYVRSSLTEVDLLTLHLCAPAALTGAVVGFG
jgi:hypothetical protein